MFYTVSIKYAYNMQMIMHIKYDLTLFLNNIFNTLRVEYVVCVYVTGTI